MTVNDRLNMVVVPTEVIWKWQQYGNNFIAVYTLSQFNKIPFEQSFSFNNECTHQGTAKWISLDRPSLGKRIIKWGSLNKTDFFCENNLSESNK